MRNLNTLRDYFQKILSRAIAVADPEAAVKRHLIIHDGILTLDHGDY